MDTHANTKQPEHNKTTEPTRFKTRSQKGKKKNLKQTSNKARNPYVLWKQEKFPKIKFNKEIGKKWKTLPNTEKQRYVDEATKNQRVHKNTSKHNKIRCECSNMLENTILLQREMMNKLLQFQEVIDNRFMIIEGKGNMGLSEKYEIETDPNIINAFQNALNTVNNGQEEVVLVNPGETKGQGWELNWDLDIEQITEQLKMELGQNDEIITGQTETEREQEISITKQTQDQTLDTDNAMITGDQSWNYNPIKQELKQEVQELDEFTWNLDDLKDTDQIMGQETQDAISSILM